MSQLAAREIPEAPEVRLEMEPGTVRATVSLPGEDNPARVVISVDACPARLRCAANGLFVTGQGWRTPFETGVSPNHVPFARAVAMRAGLGSFGPGHLRATCSCPAGPGGCAHAAAAVAGVMGELSRGYVRTLWLHGLDLEEWARSPDVAEAGVVPRRLSACWKSKWEAEEPEPLGELPDLSAIPNLLEETLRRLRAAPPRGDLVGILRDGMLAAARNASDPERGGGSPIPVGSLDRVRPFLDPDGNLVSLSEDHEWGAVPRRRGFWNYWEPRGDRLGALLVDSLRRVAPEDLGGLGETGRYWVMLFRYVERLAAQCALVPELVRGRRQGTHRIAWRPATMLSEPLCAIHGRFVRACPPELALSRAISRHDQTMRASQETQVRLAVDLLFRGILGREDGHGGEEWDETGLLGVRDGAEPILFGRQPFAFRPDDGVTEDDFQVWLRRLAIPDRHPRVRVRVAPDSGDPDTIRVGLEFLGGDGGPVPLGDILADWPTTWFVMALEFLSEAVGQDAAAAAGDRARVSLAVPVGRYKEVVPAVVAACRRSGSDLEVADVLRSLGRPRLCYRMSADGTPGAGAFDLSALAEFDPAVAVGDAVFPVGEFEALVQEARETLGERTWRDYSAPRSTVRHVGGRYAELGDEFLFEEFDRHASRRKRLSHFELLRAALTGEHAGSEVFLLPSVDRLFREILSPRDRPDPPGDLAKVLRPYQRTGFEWLAQNADVGFGSILADDMGLGKTLQAIALILHRTLRDPSHKTLVVAPTALLTNWAREVRRFAPALRTQVHHGGARDLDPSRHDVVVTSHGIAWRDTKALGKRAWGLMVVDEAQAIKNPATKQAQAIKSYKAAARVALTGTPVENHLEDYWSIFDYTNRGYLGSRQGFGAGLARPIERDRDEDALGRFRRLTGPFILRRLKADREIAKDLPEKIEGRQYCSLTARQAALYQATIDTMMEEVAGAGDETDPGNIRRRGLILKMLTQLKQVCNSPAHLLGDRTAPPSESGKLALCLEILEELRETGEKALVFTQYVEMGRLLVDTVRSETGDEPLFLHGGLARKARDEIVDTFQGDPARRNMVLSLKAGGTGLNLTAATQVIHFDRWWNPAVERQATDRAHRIGQTRRVQVHLLVTENTLEEKIDAMLEDKRELAELTVQSGEKWLTDMTDRQLRELVELTRPLE